MPKEDTMTWDEPTDKHLLLAFLNLYSNVQHDWEALAKMMGPKCTSRAVHERVKNLQKKAKATFDETSPAYPGGVAATPRKRPARSASETRARKVKKAKSDTKPEEEKEQEQLQEVEKQEQPQEVKKQEQPEDNLVAKDEPMFEGFD